MAVKSIVVSVYNQLACKVGDHARQTGKHKRIARLPGPRKNIGITMAFLSPQRSIVAMHSDVIAAVDSSKTK